MEPFSVELDNIRANQSSYDSTAIDSWESIWTDVQVTFQNYPWILESIAMQTQIQSKYLNVNNQCSVFGISPSYLPNVRQYYSYLKISTDYIAIRTGMDILLNNPPSPLPTDLFQAIQMSLSAQSTPLQSTTIPEIIANYISTLSPNTKQRIPTEVYCALTSKITTNISPEDFDAYCYMDTYVDIMHKTLSSSSYDYITHLRQRYTFCMLACISGLNSFGIGNRELEPLLNVVQNNLRDINDRYENYLSTVKNSTITNNTDLNTIESNRRNTH